MYEASSAEEFAEVRVSLVHLNRLEVILHCGLRKLA